VPSAEALAWARRAFPGLDPLNARPLPPAGSSRTLTRLFHTGGSLVLVENPVEITSGVNENDAFGYLAAHLGARGIPVPGMLAYKRSRGWMLVEDLGDRDLYAEVRRALHGQPQQDEAFAARERIAALYREALAVLVRLQIDGAAGFDPRRTHNPPRYDAALMREGESGYFVRELLGRHLGLGLPPGLDAELDRLADRAAAAGTPYLLHRDYQSQNLKIHLDRICVIDFQGARFGPAQYDLAALLLDPYADLPADLRRELLDHYLDEFAARTREDRWQFLERYPLIAAHRLMQALGAYAFLGLQRGKPAFLAHIPAALRLLEETVAPIANTVPRLVAIVAEARMRVSATGCDDDPPGAAGRVPAG
jgi:aminoglycoside/choline kinase family phosphotransferase